eukprot:maker-scaffold923_size80782-snap-gene-0.14 protein:Tk06065 transcript:maker-scaffold923_size80782-snap-gene-0.14-mRNA-1 annotation:"---NA---"
MDELRLVKNEITNIRKVGGPKFTVRIQTKADVLIKERFGEKTEFVRSYGEVDWRFEEGRAVATADLFCHNKAHYLVYWDRLSGYPLNFAILPEPMDFLQRSGYLVIQLDPRFLDTLPYTSKSPMKNSLPTIKLLSLFNDRGNVITTYPRKRWASFPRILLSVYKIQLLKGGNGLPLFRNVKAE